MATVTKIKSFEDNHITLMARVTDGDGVNITQSAISTITYTITNLATGTVGSPVSLTVSSVVFDSLQETALGGNRWTEDATGYNFKHAIAGTNFAAPSTTYRVEHLFTPASGNAFFAGVFEITTRPIRTS